MSNYGQPPPAPWETTDQSQPGSQQWYMNHNTGAQQSGIQSSTDPKNVAFVQQVNAADAANPGANELDSTTGSAYGVGNGAPPLNTAANPYVSPDAAYQYGGYSGGAQQYGAYYGGLAQQAGSNAAAGVAPVDYGQYGVGASQGMVNGAIGNENALAGSMGGLVGQQAGLANAQFGVGAEQQGLGNEGQGMVAGQMGLSGQAAGLSAAQMGVAGQGEGLLGQQQGLASMYGAQALGQGPNPAAFAFQQGLDKSIAAQQAMAASSRGGGMGLESGERAAAGQAGAMEQAGVAQLGMQEAQQQLSAEQGLASQQGAMGQTLGGIGSAYGNAGSALGNASGIMGAGGQALQGVGNLYGLQGAAYGAAGQTLGAEGGVMGQMGGLYGGVAGQAGNEAAQGMQAGQFGTTANLTNQGQQLGYATSMTAAQQAVATAQLNSMQNARQAQQNAAQNKQTQNNTIMGAGIGAGGTALAAMGSGGGSSVPDQTSSDVQNKQGILGGGPAAQQQQQQQRPQAAGQPGQQAQTAAPPPAAPAPAPAAPKGGYGVPGGTSATQPQAQAGPAPSSASPPPQFGGQNQGLVPTAPAATPPAAPGGLGAMVSGSSLGAPPRNNGPSNPTVSGSALGGTPQGQQQSGAALAAQQPTDAVGMGNSMIQWGARGQGWNGQASPQAPAYGTPPAAPGAAAAPANPTNAPANSPAPSNPANAPAASSGGPFSSPLGAGAANPTNAPTSSASGWGGQTAQSGGSWLNPTPAAPAPQSSVLQAYLGPSAPLQGVLQAPTQGYVAPASPLSAYLGAGPVAQPSYSGQSTSLAGGAPVPAPAPSFQAPRFDPTIYSDAGVKQDVSDPQSFANGISDNPQGAELSAGSDLLKVAIMSDERTKTEVAEKAHVAGVQAGLRKGWDIFGKREQQYLTHDTGHGPIAMTNQAAMPLGPMAPGVAQDLAATRGAPPGALVGAGAMPMRVPVAPPGLPPQALASAPSADSIQRSGNHWTAQMGAAPLAAAAGMLPPAAPGGPAITSDEEAKDPKQRKADEYIDDFADRVEESRAAYHYKDPSFEPTKSPTGGMYLGAMAQSLEKARGIGPQIVKESPRGKVLEQGPLVSAMLASQGRSTSRIKELERRVGVRR